MSFSLFSNIVGSLATILTIITLIGPITKIFEGLNNHRITHDNKIVLISILNTGLWIIYGLKLSSFPIYLTNTALYFIFLFFLNSYFWVNHEKQNIFYYTASIVLCWTICFNILPQDVAGMFAFLVNIGLCYPLIQKIKRALAKKNNDEMNMIEFQLSAFTAFLWVIYGMLLTNLIFIWIPHLISLITLIIAILTFQWTIGKIEDDHFIIINLKTLLKVNDEMNDQKMENQNQINKSLKDDF